MRVASQEIPREGWHPAHSVQRALENLPGNVLLLISTSLEQKLKKKAYWLSVKFFMNHNQEKEDLTAASASESSHLFRKSLVVCLFICLFGFVFCLCVCVISEDQNEKQSCIHAVSACTAAGKVHAPCHPVSSSPDSPDHLQPLKLGQYFRVPT